MLLATKNALPCSNGCLLWGNGSTWVLMEWAKIFIQNFFAAKVLVWIIDEDISDLKIHLSPICRVRTFPGPFFTFEFHSIEGVQELWSKSFKWSGRGLNPGPSACQSSIITTIPRSFVVAKAVMWLLWMSTSSIRYSNTSLSPPGTMRKPWIAEQKPHDYSGVGVSSQDLLLGFKTFHI